MLLRATFLSLFALCLVSASAWSQSRPEEFFVYVSNERSGDVTVIDGQRDEVIATIPVGKRRPEGSSAAYPARRLYVAADATAETHAGMERSAPKAASPAENSLPPAEQAPAEPLPTPRSRKLPEAKPAAPVITSPAMVALVDLTSNSVISQVPADKRVWGVSVSPSGTKLYSVNPSTNQVSVVDLKSRREIKRIPVGDGPWGVAVAPSAGAAAQIAAAGQ